MNDIGFDHSYTEDMGHKFLKALGKAGFVLAENQVEHPGKQFCRFIMFRHGPGRNYLEFVHVGKGGERVDKPGVSLHYAGPLKKYFESIKKRKGLKAKYIHKNYEWKRDSKSALPGWNFVTFSRPAFKNIYPWFTEYELRPGKKRVLPQPHPNTAQYVAGIELEVRDTDRSKLGEIFGKDLRRGNASIGDFQLYLNPGDSTRISALVIKCKNLNLFMRKAKIGTKVLWNGQNAVLIKNPARGTMWNIVAVDKLPAY